jgi:hypothetical protein
MMREQGPAEARGVNVRGMFQSERMPGHGLALRQVRVLALLAIEQLADMLASSLFGSQPWAHLPRRVMPDVLGVAALQIGNPVGSFVLVESCDASLHSGQPLPEQCSTFAIASIAPLRGRP